MPAGWRRRAGGSGTQCQTATCSAEPEEHATMLVTLGTLVAGLAVVAVAFDSFRVARDCGVSAGRFTSNATLNLNFLSPRI